MNSCYRNTVICEHLQTLNARLIAQPYLVIFDNGGGILERDFSSARAFELLSA